MPIPGMTAQMVFQQSADFDISYLTNSTSISTTITGPSEIQAGDLLVLFDLAYYFPSAVVPSGFTSIKELNNSMISILSYKIADGSEANASITGMYGPDATRKILVVYRPTISLASLSVGGVVGNITSNNPPAQTIAASGATGISIGVACFSSVGAISPRTTSITPDHELSSSVNSYLQDYKQTESPSDYTFDMDDEGIDNALIGCYFHNFTT